MKSRSSSARSRRPALAGAVMSGAVMVGAACVVAVGAPAGASLRSSVTGTYSCTASALGQTATYTGTISVTGATPKSVAGGATVSMTGLRTSVTIPAATVNEIVKYTNTISGSVSLFDVIGTHATKSAVNAAKLAWKIPSTKLVANTPLSLTLPATAITVGTWTADSSAGTMVFKTGKVKLTIHVSVSGLSVNVPVSCTPNPSAVISRTKVS